MAYHPVIEKDGVLITLPLSCGTCGHVGKVVYMQWCAACCEGMCPSCMPGGQDSLPRCERCLAENRPTGAELAGMRAAEQREQAFFDRFCGLGEQTSTLGTLAAPSAALRARCRALFSKWLEAAIASGVLPEAARACDLVWDDEEADEPLIARSAAPTPPPPGAAEPPAS